MRLKRFLAFMVAFAMVMSVMPAMSLTAFAEDDVVFTVGNVMTSQATTLEEAIALTEYFYETIGNVAILGAPVITLEADYELDAPVVVDSDYPIIIDLNGHAMTYNSTTQGEAMITNKGTLTINDSSEADTGVINYNYTGEADSSYGKGNYTISNAGTLTVNGGNITIANLRAHAKYPIDNNSTTGDAILVINGGHLYNYNTSAIRQFCNSTTNKNSVTINGGLIEGYCAIWVQNPGSNTVNGSLSITGGEIKTTAAAYVNGTSELKDVSSRIYCTIAGDGGAWSEDSAVSITGGTINENVSLAAEAPESIMVNEETATFNGYVELPAPEGLEGEGTEENPYLINNLAELKWFRDKVDEQASDGSTQFAGKYFLLTDNIDLAGENWNPIGSMSGDHGSFKGVFDGGNHTIKNLNVQQAGNGIGLFARTAGNAEIKNLTLENVTVKSTDNSNYVGAVVGNSYASTKITNVHVTGSIDISGRGYIGGISGHGYVVMDNVSVVGEGTISSTFWCAGGILGYGGEGATNITNAKVEGTGEGLTVTSAAGGLGSIVGMAEDNDGTQPIAGSNLSAKNVNIETYTGAYGDGYANYALGYLYGGNPTSILTGTLSVEDVTITTSSGAKPEVQDAVASIGDAIYFDLQSAVDAGGEVTLLRNITLADTVKVAAGKTVVLDLAGYTISQTKAQTTGYQMILNDGDLTIKDSVGTGKISYTDSGNGGEYISDTIYNRGVLVINGGTIENLSSDTVATNGYPHAVDTYSGIRDASVTINGGTIYCAEYSAIRMFCVSDTYKADLVINDGAVIKGAVDMQNGTKDAANGTLTVNGGTFETTRNANNIRFANWNGGATEYGIEAAITGGTFNGGITTAYVPAAANWNKKIISGGTFTNDLSEYVAEGFEFVENADGTYGVEAVDYVAQIGEVKYESLADAVKEAQAGETVTLLDDVTGNVDVNNAIVLDGNDKTITGKLSVTADGATVKNAIVNNGNSTAAYIGAKDVLIENCTVTGGSGFRYCYTDGTVTFKDSTITGSVYGIHFDGNDNGNIIIDNCKITGWTSFARKVTAVTMKNTEFCEGGYNYIRFYQNATIENCTFNEKMAIDVANDLSDITIAVTGDGAELFDAYDVHQYTILDNGTALVTEASVTTGSATKYYFTLEEALEEAVDGDTVTLLADINATDIIVLNKEITLDGNDNTLTSSAGRAINVDTTKKVIIKNLTVAGEGKCERGINVINNASDLTLENVNVSDVSHYAVHVATSAGAAKVTVKDGSYCGYAAIAVYGAGTEINVTDAILVGINTYEDNGSNSFATIVTGAENTTVNVTGGSIKAVATAGKAPQAVVGANAGATGTITLDSELIVEGVAKYISLDPTTVTLVVRETYAVKIAKEGFGTEASGTAGLVKVGGTIELPTATVTEITKEQLEAGGAPELTFALNFLADEASDEQKAYYGNWYADYVLTLGENATFNANGGADGYLAGQYNSFSTGWVSVPDGDVAVNANTPFRIMKYAAEALNEPGLQFTYAMVLDWVKDFDCGIFFEPEFIEANPGMEVTLQLRLYNPDDETENYLIGETYTFKFPDLGAIKVTYADGTVGYFDDILEAVPFKTNYDKLEGATIKLLDDYTGSGIRFMENDMVLDLNGYTYTINEGTGSNTTRTSALQIRPEVATTATIKNGTIAIANAADMDETWGSIAYMINNYAANLVIDDVVLDCTNITWSYGTSAYAIVSRSGDNVELTGTTKIVGFNTTVGVDSIWNGGSMTVEDTVTELGTITLTTADAEVTAAEGLDVVSGVDNYGVEYEGGKYALAGYVAKVGEESYTTLQAAIDAVVANGEGTVTLLADTAEDVEIADYVTVNLVTGDYAYTGAVTMTAYGAWIIADEEINATSTFNGYDVVEGVGNGKFGYVVMKHGVDMIKGAQVRIGSYVDEDGKIANATTNKSGSGLRFITKVDRQDTLAGMADHADGEYTATENGIEYIYTKGVMGIIVGAEGSTATSVISADSWQTEDIFTSAITNLAVSNYVRKFTANAYVDVDGIRYVNKVGVTRSIYQVAEGLLATGKVDEDASSDGNHEYNPTDAKLLDVLNAYVNQAGIRLILVDGELLAHDGLSDASIESGRKGYYGAEAFFTVGDTTSMGDVYKVVLTPRGNAVIKTNVVSTTNQPFWYEYVRINNNNGAIKTRVKVTDNKDGTYTLEFDTAGTGLEPNDNTPAEDINEVVGTDKDAEEDL